MDQQKKAFLAAFPVTIPVLTGFLFLGFAYGILMDSKGYGVFWAFLMSALVFAGSLQYASVTLLTTAFDPINALVLALMINARHLFYGISLLERYRGMGKWKPYLIFGLCDETFSILCANEAPKGVDRRYYAFFVTLLDHSYWVLGSVLGAWIGALVEFNTEGIDFVLTALFVVIFTSQWKRAENRTASVIGVSCAVICLILFGGDQFILPTMGLILIVVTIGQKHLQKKADRREKSCN